MLADTPACPLDFNDGTEKLMCVFETTEGRGRFSVKSVVSPDEGVSWEPLRSIVYAPTDATKNGACSLLLHAGTCSLSVLYGFDYCSWGPADRRAPRREPRGVFHDGRGQQRGAHVA